MIAMHYCGFSVFTIVSSINISSPKVVYVTGVLQPQPTQLKRQLI